MLSYPATFERTPDDEGITVRFRDFPEAISFADDERDALAMATDVMDEVLAGRLNRWAEIHRPSEPRRGETLIPVPTEAAVRVLLRWAMDEVGVDKCRLAGLMSITQAEIDQLLDLKHEPRWDRLDAAFRALGKRLNIVVAEAA